MCKVVAYVGTWAHYRARPYNFSVDDINPNLCTHLIYAFAGLDESTCTIKIHDSNYDIANGGYKKATNLRNRNPSLKVLIAIGGYTEGSAKYSKMAASANTRQRFVSSVVQFIRQYGFDGLDLDWEYPGLRGGGSADKNNFTLLIKDLRSEFDRHGWLLTAALGAGREKIDAGYDIRAISGYLDFMNIMTYDYHGDWDGRAGVNAPLQAQNDGFSVEDTLNYLVRLGAPRAKLILGLAMYGKTFNLTTSQRRLGAPCSTGFSGKYTNENGMLAYYEICELKNEGWTEYWDDATSTPYLMNGPKLVSFDNVKSFRMKIDFGRRFGVGGFMAWSIDTDDIRGISGETFALLRQMNM